MTARSFLDKRCPLEDQGYIVRKDVLVEEGLFANHLVDDYDLTFRLLRKKHRIAFAPLCIDYDGKATTMEIMLRQRARWAKGFIRFTIKENSGTSRHNWKYSLAQSYYQHIWDSLCFSFLHIGIFHNLIYGYYPYTYSYMPVNLWFVLTGLIYGLQVPACSTNNMA